MARTDSHQTQDTYTDTVIVGGGLAGLTAACYLAKSGRAVTLFERAAGLGGRAATQFIDGYAVNRGAHALYTGGAASEILRELGVTYHAAVPKKTFTLSNGELYRLPATPATLLTSRLLSWADKLELLRFFTALPRLDARTLAGTSVQDWLDSTVQRARVHQLMTSIAWPSLYTTALDLVSAEVLVDKLQRALKHPIHYVDGGWQTLVEGLRQKAEAAGARIVSGTRVETVLYQDGRVTGVRTRDEDTISASAVIVATPPHEASALVDGGEYPALRRLVDPLVPVTLACVDVALRTLPDPEHPVVSDFERPLFLTAQSRYARIAPEGAALIHTFKQFDPRQETAAAEDKRDLESLLDAAQPGWRDALVHEFSLPHIMAVGALPLARTGGFAGRPEPEVPGLAGLFLAGDWVGPEGYLIDASMASARQAARLALQQSPARPSAPHATATPLAEVAAA